MTKYETILAKHKPCHYCTLRLETSVNKMFSKQVATLLEKEGYQVQGLVGLYQDSCLPNLWHVFDNSQNTRVALDFVFNAKTERLHNKCEEVV